MRRADCVSVMSKSTQTSHAIGGKAFKILQQRNNSLKIFMKRVLENQFSGSAGSRIQRKTVLLTIMSSLNIKKEQISKGKNIFLFNFSSGFYSTDNRFAGKTARNGGHLYLLIIRVTMKRVLLSCITSVISKLRKTYLSLNK